MDVSLALRNPGQIYAFDQALALTPMTVADDPVRFEAVQISGQYVSGGESVTIEAHIDARIHTRCAKCLEDASYSISCEVDETFVRNVNEDDPDRYPLNGSGVDLEPMVREALILEMPMRVLCRKDCKGLCPICGNNRNVSPCTCQEGGARLNSFSALSELLTEDEEV